MARQLRIEYEGACYHVMCRGNGGEPIYKDDHDRELFLKTLWECCKQTGWVVHAYVLMGNHYHLLLETPEANLVAGMKERGQPAHCVIYGLHAADGWSSFLSGKGSARTMRHFSFDPFNITFR